MGPVLKKHIIRHRGHFDPLDRLLLILVILELLYLRIVRRRNLMTTDAALGGGNTGNGVSPRINMAILARNFIIPGVDFVVEGDGLCGNRRFSRQSNPEPAGGKQN